MSPSKTPILILKAVASFADIEACTGKGRHVFSDPTEFRTC